MPYNILILGSQGSGKTTLISYFTGRPFQSITRVTIHQLNLLGESLQVNFIEGRELSEEHTETLPNIIIILFDLNALEPCTTIKPWLVESRRINKDAHITLIGTHLVHPETRVLDTETIDELCIQQEVSLAYYEVGTANIISRYRSIILTNLARLVAIQKLKMLRGKDKNNFLDLVYRWSFSNNSYELTSTLFDHGYHPSKVVVGEFAKQAGISLFNKYPAIQYCMVTNKVFVNPNEYSLQPLNAKPISSAHRPWEPHDMEQPLKTECCRAQYSARFMIDWSEKKLRCLHPSWFSYKTDLFNYHSLSVIKLRKNKLYFIPREIYTIQELTYLDISHNRLSVLPGLWILGSKLQVLLANDNSILTIDLENYGFNEETFEPNNSKDGKNSKSAFYLSASQDLLGLFGEDFFKKSKCQIWMLQLQNNNLQEIPVPLLDCLKQLEYLDISNNPIKLLNGNLSNTLKYINVDNLPLISPPRYIADLGLTHLRTYLNQLSAVDSNNNNIWNRHRIIVVGLLNSGKTALIHKLLDKPYTKRSDRMDQGLRIHEWRTRSKTLQFWKRLDSLFDFWDFSGDSIFQPLYNMFRPSSSLHIIVCNIVDFLKEIKFQNSLKEPLRILIMSLQAISWKKDRSLICVLVFTHLDELVKDEKETKKVLVLNSIRKYIKDMNLVLISDMSNSIFTFQPDKPCIKLNPDGVNLLPTVIDIHFVSSVTGENINKLQARLTQDIFIRVEQAAYAKTVPILYIEFERRIREVRESVKNRQRRKCNSQQPFERFFTQPLVCSDDIYHSLRGAGLLKREVGPDYGKEAVSDMLTFFHEEGILFKHVTGESQCYISFNLQLLGDVISDILLHSQMGIGNCFNNSPAGILPLDNLAMIFAPTNISFTKNPSNRRQSEVTVQDKEDSLEQEGEVPYVLEEFLKFLTANNICTRLSKNYVIAPAGLETDLPRCVRSAEEGRVGANTFLAGNSCRRIYKMRFIPLGFWNVLLMRLLANLLPISLPGGIELNKLEQFETLNFQPEYHGHKSTQTSLPRELRTDMEDISKSYVTKCLPNGTLLESDGIRYELKEFPTSELYYWATGLVITSDQGWNLKVCGCDDTMLEPGFLSDSQGIQLSLYADKDNVEARLLRLTHDVIIQTIQVHFPGLCFSSEKCIPWVEVYAIVDNLSCLLPDQQSSHPSSFRVKLFSDILLHSLSPAAGDAQVDLRDAMPDLLIKDMPSQLNLTQSSNYIFFEGSIDQEEEVFNETVTNSCYFHRCYCSSEERKEIEKSPGGLQQQILLEAPYKQMIREVYNIFKISNESVVKFVGVSFHPPTALLARSPYGSLRTLLTENSTGLDTIASHAVAMQVVRGLFFLELQNICHTQLTSDTVLVHHKDPMLIKLSDAGISYLSKSKTLVNTREEQDLLLANEPSLPLLQFGFLLYEISTGCRPFEGIYSLQEVMRLALHSKLYLNIEAHLLYTVNEQGDFNRQNRRKTSAINLSDGRSVQLGYGSAVDIFELKQAEVSACHRLCMQPLLENCLKLKNRIIMDLPMIASKLTLCAGEIGWSPLSSDINVQCIVCTDKQELYWASGTRGLLVGHINPKNGKCIIRALTKPDKRRNNTEQLQAIGNVTAMRIVQSTNQLWIGVEDTNKGALYVYDLPDMNNYYSGQLQDAVLSLMPIDDKWECVKLLNPSQEGLEVLKYRVLVGLANGNIMIFMGMKDGKVVENPLAGDKAVLLQENKPCRGILITPCGLIWAACGHKMLVINPLTLKEHANFKEIVHHREKEIQAPYFSTKSRNRFTAKETVIDMVISGPWIWTIARRCSYIWIWSWETGCLLLTFDLQILPDINRKEVSQLTAIAPQGNLLWVGTKSGTLLLLDVVMIRSLIPEQEKQKSREPEKIKFNRKSVIGTALSSPITNSLQSQQSEELPQVSDLVVEESPLIAYQHCSKGKIRSIEPIPTVHTSGDVEVICSVEQNETASRLMVWRFQSSAIQTRTKLCSSAYSSNSYSQGGTIKRGMEIRSPLFSEDLNTELPFQSEQKSDESDQSDDNNLNYRANTLPSMARKDSLEKLEEHLLLQENTVVQDISNGDERETESQDMEYHFNL